MTSLEQELEEQHRWRLLPKKSHRTEYIQFLVSNEFSEPEHRNQRLVGRARTMFQFAERKTGHYRDEFAKAKFVPQAFDSLDQLPDIPILTRENLQGENAALLAGGSKDGERWFKSTGTTGRPTSVLRGKKTSFLFVALAQRCYRWYRMDPMGTFAGLLFTSSLPRDTQGKALPIGSSGQQPRWKTAGQLFQTGPYKYFTGESPVEEHLAWLTKVQPDYLQSYSENLEHIALAAENHWPVPSIKSMMGISEQMTPSMRSLIEKTTGAKVEDSYGLNEIGLVANRCEAGSYHVHTEQCIAEVIAEDGSPCAEGETGRLVVTSLENWCMPMIRYDTGDLARATYQPCPCGRTLPSFRGIVGRYSRVAFLPENTWESVLGFRGELETLPTELLGPIRQFQVVQRRDLSHDLHLIIDGPLNPALEPILQKKWARIVPETWSLRIKKVDQLHRSEAGKFEFLISEFNPAFDIDAA